MRSSQIAVYDAPATAAEILEFLNDSDVPATVIVENLDALSSAPVKLVESNDSMNWSDITGAYASVNPGDSVRLEAVSTMARIGLNAGGSVKLQVSVERQINGAPYNLGSA